MKLAQRLFLTFGLCIACATFAEAHAFLDHADPRVGSTLTGSPSVVKIWFTEEIEPAFSKIQVFDAKAGEVDQKDSKVDSTDKSLMSVSVSPLPAGVYKVMWSAVAVDTHHTTGTFTFTVTAP